MLTIVQGLHSEPGIAAVWAGHSAGGVSQLTPGQNLSTMQELLKI